MTESGPLLLFHNSDQSIILHQPKQHWGTDTAVNTNKSTQTNNYSSVYVLSRKWSILIHTVPFFCTPRWSTNHSGKESKGWC